MVSVFNVKTMQKPRIKTIYFTAENYNYILSLQEKYKYLTFNKAVNEIISKQKESEMSTKEDLKKYPVYIYLDGNLIKLPKQEEYTKPFNYSVHHFVRTQYLRNHKDKETELLKIQKLFLLPNNMHADLHACSRSFEGKYGYKRSELLYGASDE